jgi:hypothetical protein
VEHKLTNVAGLELKSEFSDKVLYNTIRSLQFLFLHTYKLGSNLLIEETNRGRVFLYGIENKELGLRGYIGRDEKRGIVRYLVMDGARIRWMVREGFDLTPENYDKVGVMLVLPSMNDFILFMAGRGGWETEGYVNTEEFKAGRRRKKN